MTRTARHLADALLGGVVFLDFLAPSASFHSSSEAPAALAPNHANDIEIRKGKCLLFTNHGEAEGQNHPSKCAHSKSLKHVQERLPLSPKLKAPESIFPPSSRRS